MPTDNVHSLELQRAIATLGGSISKFVGAAAALEAARGFMQVQVSTEALGDRFDPVAVARSVVQTRVTSHEAYGASWKDVDVTEISTILAFTWVEACAKDKTDDVSPADVAALEAEVGGRAPDADF